MKPLYRFGVTAKNLLTPNLAPLIVATGHPASRYGDPGDVLDRDGLLVIGQNVGRYPADQAECPVQGSEVARLGPVPQRDPSAGCRVTNSAAKRTPFIAAIHTMHCQIRGFLQTKDFKNRLIRERWRLPRTAAHPRRFVGVGFGGAWRHSVVARCRDCLSADADSSAFVRSHSGLTCRAKDQFLRGYVVVAAHSNGNHQAGGGCECSDGRDGCGNPVQVCEKA